MAETISQYQIAPFTTPQNGQPGDADQVRGNDNTVGTGHNSHDADSGVHFQSSLLANRPASGTAGRKWYTTDTKRAYYDTGAGWDEFGYLPLSGGTLSGSLTVGANLSVASTLLAPASLALQSTGANAITFATNGTSRWSIASTGHILAASDGSIDIGQTATGRPRTLYVSTSVAVAGSQVVGARATGYGAFTGTLNRASALDTSTVTLAQLAGRVMALQTDLTNHGLIGS